MQEDPVISVENIHKSYGSKRVLRGVTLEAGYGDFVCIVGENGSGKSTLIKIIAGYIKPEKGRIFRNGDAGYCPQKALLYNYLTVKEHFQLFGAAYGMTGSSIEKNSDELMEIFAFKDFHHHLIHQLSGGTQQKLNLSLSLLHDPVLLLLDEPYAGFDHETYQKFLNYTDLALARKKCIIMISHLVYKKQYFNSVLKLTGGLISEENI